MADYLGCSIQAAIATESAASGDEDHHHNGGVSNAPEGEASFDLDKQVDGGEEEGQCSQDLSDYIEAHRYIGSRKPGRLPIAGGGGSIWLRHLPTAPSIPAPIH